MTQHRGHVVLVGDSIFDNGAYTRGEPDVIAHLRDIVPDGWRATSCARDGARTGDLSRQLACVPADTSHLVVSIGGNDALQNSDLLSMRVSSTAATLELFADRLAAFERAYRAAVQRALSRDRRTAVCTVYNGALDPERATAARVGLALFNDAILRTAIDWRLDALELRSVCTEPGDYANPIEPSGQGGLKIARAIARVVGALADDAVPARVWGGE